jgi:hypothetical protein
MVSVPVSAPDYRKVILFPTAKTNAFAFQNGYVAKDTLMNGAGYWLKFDVSQDISMFGAARNSDSINVSTGWNMIGSVSSALPITKVIPSPGVIIVSSFYKYQNGYATADSLLPGKAYWVKTSATGKLYLNNSVSKSIEIPEDIKKKD